MIKSNLLGNETSPYLLQHKNNPVHWMAWSPRAFQIARSEEKPVLLSVGYAACHWCHVMAHESFEDTVTAQLMNANFINIKVDREERPDIDKVYMTALQALGQQGGWPLTMFLDGDGRPFWGGTYFPPEPKYSQPAFKTVLTEISRIWREEPYKIKNTATAIIAGLQRPATNPPNVTITAAQIETAANVILEAVDPQFGGLRGAPKFPQAPIFEFLWSTALHPYNPARVAAVGTTLTQISQGGIYDHLGGGIARYSVDALWLVPHFEKMLYDNAQYVSLLTRVWLATSNPLYRIRIEETINFVLSQMTTPEGLFASSYDADSEGEEGKYYIWSKSEIETVLGPVSASQFCHHYGVTSAGNWERHNILNRSHNISLQNHEIEASLSSARKQLLSSRATRPKPGFDNKVLADWNGLMISALAEAAWVFQQSHWAAAARSAMAAILRIHWHDNRLFHSSKGTDARHEATSDGYANLITACRALHLLTADAEYLNTATELAEALIKNHWDQSEGGLLFASRRAEELPVRIRTIHDDATPNANGVMIANFAALHHLNGMPKHLNHAQKIATAFSADVQGNPFAAPTYLKNIRYLYDPIQIVITGSVSRQLLYETVCNTGLDIIIQQITDPNMLPADHPARAKFSTNNDPAIFICRGNTCAAPVRHQDELTEALNILGLRMLPSGIH